MDNHALIHCSFCRAYFWIWDKEYYTRHKEHNTRHWVTCLTCKKEFSTYPGDTDMLLSDYREILIELVAVLQDESKWPPGFKWDYKHHSTCALALSLALGNQLIFMVSSLDNESVDKFWTVFSKIHWTLPGNVAMSGVTPMMVAEGIDKYILRGEELPIITKEKKRNASVRVCIMTPQEEKHDEQN